MTLHKLHSCWLVCSTGLRCALDKHYQIKSTHRHKENACSVRLNFLLVPSSWLAITHSPQTFFPLIIIIILFLFLFFLLFLFFFCRRLLPPRCLLLAISWKWCARLMVAWRPSASAARYVCTCIHTYIHTFDHPCLFSLYLSLSLHLYLSISPSLSLYLYLYLLYPSSPCILTRTNAV